MLLDIINKLVNETKESIEGEKKELNIDEVKNYKLEENIEVNEAPGDNEQVEEIVNVFENTSEIKPEIWSTLDLNERLNVFNGLENSIAAIEHRPPANIEVKQMEENMYGYYDPATNTINLNERDFLGNSSENYKENLDTLLHEGRHAYQDYNVGVNEVHPNHEAVEEWSQNYVNGYETGEIPFDFNNVGPKLYEYQPVEYDARIFAGNVIDDLKKEWNF